jgi:hypothetical protein
MALLGQFLSTNYIGDQNTAIGDFALQSNTTGSYNTANGSFALSSDTTASYNTANGSFALQENPAGSYNTANGYDALDQDIAFTGSFNTADGTCALSWAHGNNNTGIGVVIRSSLSGYYTNSTCLGCTSTVTDKVTIGPDFEVGISDESIGGQVGWSTFSDGRFKTNIKENVPGLAFINKLKPVTYNLEGKKFDKFLGKKDSLINSRQGDYAVSEKKVHTGFVAQDVEKAVQELHYDFDGLNHPQNEKDYYSLVFADFVPSLVKAEQELNDSLVRSNASLQSQVDELRTLVQELADKSGGASSSKDIAPGSAKPDQNTPITIYLGAQQKQ